YTDGNAPIKTTTAVAILARQQLEGWGPQNPRMATAIKNYFKPNLPKTGLSDVYFYYYATQVMHNVGGEDWTNWNVKNRDVLIDSQNSGNANPALEGSWDPKSDQWGRTGGRLMVTSLNLLSLEVYYRYPPFQENANFWPEKGESKKVADDVKELPV